MGKWHGQTSPRKVSQCKAATWTRNADLILSLSQHFSTIAVVTPQTASSEPGSLEVRFKEATDAAQGRSAMRIERNGSVFLN
jgi:hypothetical protein